MKLNDKEDKVIEALLDRIKAEGSTELTPFIEDYGKFIGVIHMRRQVRPDDESKLT